jgi:DNA-binding FadR family transcriptional regulator
LARRKELASTNGNLTDAILCWIENYIEENHLQVGDALPTEDIIVKETGTSRTSAREALSRLRALGVIESRRKRGMRLIRPLDLIDLARVLGNNTIPPDLVCHVGGFRSALELGMESEIFRRASNQDITELPDL